MNAPLDLTAAQRAERQSQVVRAQISHAAALDLTVRREPIVVMPMMAWTRVSRAGLQFASNISSEIHVLQVSTEEGDKEFINDWGKAVEGPLHEGGQPLPKLIVLRSPYRFVIGLLWITLWR